MKVIKPGREQEGWSIETICSGRGNGGGGCGATLLVEQPDLYETYRFNLGERDTYCTFTCCECFVETDLDPRSQPPRTLQLPDRVGWLAKKSQA
jgi:hypothetical protein